MAERRSRRGAMALVCFVLRRCRPANSIARQILPAARDSQNAASLRSFIRRDGILSTMRKEIGHDFVLAVGRVSTTCCAAADSSMFRDWHRPCVPTCCSSQELVETDSKARSRRLGNGFHWPMHSALRAPQARGKVGDPAGGTRTVYEVSNWRKEATQTLQQGYDSRPR